MIATFIHNDNLYTITNGDGTEPITFYDSDDNAVSVEVANDIVSQFNSVIVTRFNGIIRVDHSHKRYDIELGEDYISAKMFVVRNSQRFYMGDATGQELVDCFDKTMKLINHTVWQYGMGNQYEGS